MRAALLSASGQKSYLTAASGLIWPTTSTSAINNFITWLPYCLRYVRISYATLIRLDLPSEALDIVLKLIDEIRIYCLTTIFKKAIEKVKKLEEHETWEMGVSEFPGATLLVCKNK